MWDEIARRGFGDLRSQEVIAPVRRAQVRRNATGSCFVWTRSGGCHCTCGQRRRVAWRR